MHQPGQALVAVQGILGLRIADEAFFARLDFHGGPGVLVAVEKDVLGFAHQLPEDAGEFGQPFDRFNAGNGAGFGLGVLVPLPGAGFFVRLAQEQHLAQVLAERPGRDEQDGLLLLDAREIEQVGIGHQHQRAVGVGRQDVVGIDDGERIRGQQLLEPRPIFHEQGGVDRCVSHELGGPGVVRVVRPLRWR